MLFSPSFRPALPLYVLSAITLLYVSSAVDASAHPFFVDSTPKPFQNIPEQVGEVSVFFSEPIELPYSDISILGPDGTAVDKGDAHNVNGEPASIGVGLQDNLQPGIYTVNTRVLSAVDGHVVDNSITFGIGTEIAESSDVGESQSQPQTEIISVEESLSRFPGYVGQIIAFGAAFAMIWLLKPLNQMPWLSGSLEPFRRLVGNGAIKILILGSSLILVSGVAMIIVQSESVDASILDIISTKFGNVWTVRIIQASALTVLSVAIYRKYNRKREVQVGRLEIIAVLALALALLVTYSLIAHAAASGHPLAILADFCHSLVASIWIGGLIFLAFAVIPKLRVLQMEDKIKSIVISILIPRFTTIVVVALGVILITGPLLLWTLESDLGITLASLYGKILLAKLSIGSVMIALGGYHQVISQRKLGISVMLSRTPNRNKKDFQSFSVLLGPASFAKHLKHLSKALKIEASLGVGLLAMVSLMANMSLPSGEFPAYERLGVAAIATTGTLEDNSNAGPKEFSQTAYLDSGQKIQLVIDPFTVGQNAFEVSFFDSNNSISTLVDSSVLKLTQVEKGIGPIVVNSTEQSPGSFHAEAAFSIPGRWSVEVQGKTSTPGIPNLLNIFDVQVKPRVSDLQFTVEEYKTPQESLPLYPVYDPLKQVIWVGDSTPGSGRIWEFDIESKNYTAHPVGNVSLITSTALGRDGQIWYIDPTGNILGSYDPVSRENQQIAIPLEGIPAGMAIDNFQDVWLVVGGQANNVVRFSPNSNELTAYEIPTPNSLPTAIAIDGQGKIWFTESVGKVGVLDPVSGNITEYTPSGEALVEPTSILLDPQSSRVFVSEHEGHAISVLDPVFNIFSKYPTPNQEGLPFGMTLDDYGNLWFAQHVVDEIGLIDPENDETTEVQVPTSGSFVQWLVPDNQGRIWFAEQRGSSLGSISLSSRPATTAAEGTQDTGSAGGGGEEVSAKIESVLPELGSGFAEILGPLIAAGIIISAIFYSKSVLNVDRNIVIANQLESRNQ